MEEIIEGFMNPPSEYVPTEEHKKVLLSVFDILQHGGTAVVKLQRGCLKVQEMTMKEKYTGKERFV